jgi:ketosteroid isomerase-like protein
VNEPAGTRPNEEVLREGFAAFSEGRFEDALKTIDPEIEWYIAFRLPDLPLDRSIAHGHDEVMEIWRQFSSVWERLVFDPEEILYDRGERAIARIHLQAIGSSSGVELDSTLYYAMTIRNGRLRRFRGFDSPEEAAADLGVPAGELGGGTSHRRS